jgi:hypothetical protein
MRVVNRRFSLTGSLGIVLAATFLFVASSLSAQVHGVPASVTSLAPGHDFNNPPGVPASVTSLGPQGFTPRFKGNRFNHGNSSFFGPGRAGFGSSFFVPSAIWPVYISPYDNPEIDPAAYQQSQSVSNVPIQQSVAPQTPQTPTIIVIDNRGVHDATNSERAALAPAPLPSRQAVVASPVVEDRVTTLVIFRDGTRKELQNYAIMGKEFIDLSDGRMRRYPLSDLDVQATIKENNQRGVDFRLPEGSL